jgi:hypothetical protein
LNIFYLVCNKPRTTYFLLQRLTNYAKAKDSLEEELYTKVRSEFIFSSSPLPYM